MRSEFLSQASRLTALAVVVALIAACGGRSKPDPVTHAVDVPAQFDVVLLAEKDNQFDYLDAPLTVEDLRSALRYRMEESLPMDTVLLKRGEKQRVRDEHIVAVARMAVEMRFKAYVQEKSGEISEIRTTVKSE